MSKLVYSSYSTRIYETEIYRLERRWDDTAAHYYFVLMNRQDVFTDGFGGPSWRWVDKARSSDPEWVSRTALHYGLDMPFDVEGEV